jgi:long-chain fatty acid transport protein
LGAIGVPSANIPFMTLAQIQGAFTAATPTLTAKKIGAIATGKLLRNQSADVEQKGSGITPVLGANLTISEKLNIGFKYEFRTKMDLTNNTTKDFTTTYLANGDSVTMFPDGDKVANDMPAMISIGASAKATDKLTLNFGGHFYNDRAVSYGKKIKGAYVENKDVIDRNFYELAAGFEYMITDKILVSAGYLYAETGVNESYQSDLSYSLSSRTYGAGGAYNITDKIQLNLGVGFSNYDQQDKWFIHKFPGTGAYIPTNESYLKSNFFVAVGVDISL